MCDFVTFTTEHICPFNRLSSGDFMPCITHSESIVYLNGSILLVVAPQLNGLGNPAALFLISPWLVKKLLKSVPRIPMLLFESVPNVTDCPFGRLRFKEVVLRALCLRK